MVGFEMLLYHTFIGMTMTLLFIDNRFNMRLTTAIVYCTAAVQIAVLTLMYSAVGLEMVVRAYTLVTHLPSLLIFACLSRHSGWRLIFQFMSTILFCLLLQHCVAAVFYFSGSNYYVSATACLLLTLAIMAFLLLYLRPLFFQVLKKLNHGLWLICVIMMMYYFMSIYLIPDFAGLERDITILKCAISLLMLGFYVVLMFLFSSVCREMNSGFYARIYRLQLAALQSRMDSVRESEKFIRVERHDLRHRLQTVAELITQGEYAQALDFIDASQKRLDGHRLEHWCDQPLLDAVFSVYFNMAARYDIQVEAKIALPERLPVDESELAMVFANSLENAIRACRKLPRQYRKIRCKVIDAPKVMFEIANPCASDVRFDKHGRPVATRVGHGLGVQSICAFCRKYNALCKYELNNSWFLLRVIL